ncbi:MAG: aldolase/citrate lyase family protein [Pirellulaceae bacterium]|jgi:2-keto-3-deoxy-L-rhamnonate aldolase RhmA/quercetin dioxygenase-like cupin family protein|nr:aldolase/citrate lyase family protein [Pirellulaceae bacterium]
MKTDALRTLRRKLADGTPVFGLWVTLESPSITEMAVALGMDWIVVDAEHGHLDWKEIVEHVRAAVRSQTVVLVRVAERSIGLIKRALDVGADGIVVPWIESAEQLREIVSYARFPPEGVRGIGAERATCWGQCLMQHTQEANEHVLVVPVVESVAGGRAIDSMLQVEGVELFMFGPSDYSSSAGYRGQWEGPGVADQLLAIKDKILAAGKNVGIIATSNENLQERVQQGFRMVCVGIDSGLLLRGLHGALAIAGRDRRIAASFAPEGDSVGAVVERPPEAYRPDRAEVITPVGAGVVAEIGRGVSFECLVGKPQGARNLTTGLVTFAPGAELEYHLHPYAESVTLLSGALVVEVEGRRYTLTSLDNITIPRNLAHAAVNTSSAQEAIVHVAMPTEAPSRTLVDKFFSRRGMSEDSPGKDGAEHVTRQRTARRFAAGQGASFIDYFNRDLVPGIEMSGGYGVFQPGGRLLAHFHDFDESICIVEGRATCIVEGRQYALSDCATALQPRGRVHYFINQSQAPMVMIWVYGGPVPERLVVAEHNCTVEGNPWKSR